SLDRHPRLVLAEQNEERRDVSSDRRRLLRQRPNVRRRQTGRHAGRRRQIAPTRETIDSMSPSPRLLLFIALPLLAQRTMFPPVRGTHEMVAAANNLEVEAGYRILEKGGNAVDAGVASALTAAVTEQSRFGLGGEMPLLVKMAGKPVIAIS